MSAIPLSVDTASLCSLLGTVPLCLFLDGCERSDGPPWKPCHYHKDPPWEPCHYHKDNLPRRGPDLAWGC